MSDLDETPEFVGWDELPPEMQREVLRRRKEKGVGLTRAQATIRFLTHDNHLADLHPPVPGIKAMPEWMRKMPRLAEGLPQPNEAMQAEGAWEKATIRRCPGIIDYLNLGYMLPMWSDVTFRSDGESVLHQTSERFTRVAHFTPHQMPGMPARSPNATGFAVKFSPPWVMVTPPGWSTLMIPWEFDLDPRMDLVPGVLDTDHYHQISMIFRWNVPDDQDHLIKAGTPLAHLIPFRRTDFNLEVIRDMEVFDWYNHRGIGTVAGAPPLAPPPYRPRQKMAERGWVAPPAPGRTIPPQHDEQEPELNGPCHGSKDSRQGA